jgi:hypothetical protein
LLRSSRGSRRAAPHATDDVELFSDVLLYSKSLFPPLSLLDQYSIRYHRVCLQAGQLLVAHGGFAHCGFSTGAGETHAFACNIMTQEWLTTGGPEFIVRYLEWVLRLRQEVPAEDDVEAALASLGLTHAHLSNALNMCPPAYTCDLLSKLRADLQQFVTLSRRSTPPTTVGCYTLSVEQAQAALDSIRAALALLHHPEVRAMLRDYYVVEGADHVQLCACVTPVDDDGGPLVPGAELLRRLQLHPASVGTRVHGK